MVEPSRVPVDVRVANGTLVLAGAFIELPRMNVFVTFGAAYRGCGKLDAFKVRSAVTSAMAFNTGNCRM